MKRSLSFLNWMILPACFSLLAQESWMLSKFSMNENGRLQAADLSQEKQSASSPLNKPMNPGPNLWNHMTAYFNRTGGFVEYNVEITNTGTSAAGECHIGYYLSKDYIITENDVLIGIDDVPSISPGGTETKTAEIYEALNYPGVWCTGIIVDIYNQVSEDNENDNSDSDLGYPVDIPKTDLIVTDVTVSDGEGPDISYKITVKNSGTVPTYGKKLKTRVYLSTDNIINIADYLINDWNFEERLMIGASKTSWDMTSTVSGVPAGEYYLGVITDATDEVSEYDEDNNTGYADSPKVTIPETSCGMEEPEGNLVSNWCFLNGPTDWYLNVQNDGQAEGSVQNGEYTASITTGGSQSWYVQLTQDGLLIEKGYQYQVTFYARASEPKTINSLVQKSTNPWSMYSGWETFSLTASMQPFSYSFSMNEPTDANAWVVFNFGASAADVVLDNVSVVKTGASSAAPKEENPGIQKMILSQNYPNPFNPSTTIRYSVSKPCIVTLSIYDLLGQEIAMLVSEPKTPGEYSIVWDGQNHGAGIYLVQLTAGESAETRKLILQK